MSNIEFFQRPVVTEEAGVSPPENSELRKIAEDVRQAAEYTFAAVAANPKAQLPLTRWVRHFATCCKGWPRAPHEH